MRGVIIHMTRIDEIKQNIIDATSFKEPKKVPVGIDLYGWAFHYAGVTYEDVIDEPEKCSRAFCKFFDDVPIDVTCMNSIPVPPLRALNAMGIKNYVMSADKTSIVHDQVNLEYCGPDIYDEIISDVVNFQTESFPKQRTPAFRLPKAQAYNALKKAAREYKNVLNTNSLVNSYLTKEKQIYGLYDESIINYYAPFDLIFDTYRGIKNALLDIRRYPKKVKAACDAIWESQKQFLQFDPEDIKSPLPMANTIYHSECFLSPKQYDEYFFKYFKEGFGPVLEAGKKMHLFGEGSFMRFLDRFRELPKGSMIILIDEDNPFEVYKQIGDWATICAGITVDLLQFGTKQQCIDYVKKCFDTFAPGGGFIFFPNKELVSGNDAKIENVVAVYETADLLSRQ